MIFQSETHVVLGQKDYFEPYDLQARFSLIFMIFPGTDVKLIGR